MIANILIGAAAVIGAALLVANAIGAEIAALAEDTQEYPSCDSCMSLDHLCNDGEGAPEGYFLATKKEQARKGFDEAERMRKHSPFLRKHVRKRVNIACDKLWCCNCFHSWHYDIKDRY